MEIGQKLKEKRTSARLSQEALSAQIGVSRQTISSWENNRSYPDIGSILKLSDLYGVSLDELLKEDTNMRKHMEDSAVLARRYWNLLFEVSILLLPFGSLMGHWGLFWVGFVMKIMGLLMLPPLWIVRHNMFGMPREDMQKSLTGWGLFVGSRIIRLFGLGIVTDLIGMLGYLLIFENGIYLERGKRFWLVIALYLGIPLYIFGSGLASQFSEMGVFSRAQPFGFDYRIVEVEYGTATDENSIVSLEQFGNGLRIDGTNIGVFQYKNPTEAQRKSVKGIWQLVPEEEPEALYKLEVNGEDRVTLSFLIDDQLHWRWALCRIPKMYFELNKPNVTSVLPMDWYNTGTFSGDPLEVNYTTLTGTGTAGLRCNDQEITKMTVIEEYHCGDKVEAREFSVSRDKNDAFLFPEPLSRRYEGEGQYALFRVTWDGGEYLLRVDFE